MYTKNQEVWQVLNHNVRSFRYLCEHPTNQGWHFFYDSMDTVCWHENKFSELFDNERDALRELMKRYDEMGGFIEQQIIEIDQESNNTD